MPNEPYVFESGEGVHRNKAPIPDRTNINALSEFVLNDAGKMCASDGYFFIVQGDSSDIDVYDVDVAGVSATKVNTISIEDTGANPDFWQFCITPNGDYLLYNWEDGDTDTNKVNIYDIRDKQNIIYISTLDTGQVDGYNIAATNKVAVMVESFTKTTFVDISDKNNPSILYRTGVGNVGYAFVPSKGFENFIYKVTGHYYMGVGSSFACWYGGEPDKATIVGNVAPPGKKASIGGPLKGAYDIQKERTYIFNGEVRETNTISVIEW